MECCSKMIEESEETILLSHLDAMYRYALVFTRSAAATADLVQEKYLRSFAARWSLCGDSNNKAWLFTILRNIWLNQVRRTSTTREVIDLDLNGVIEKALDPHALFVRNAESERVSERLSASPRNFAKSSSYGNTKTFRIRRSPICWNAQEGP